MSKVFTNELIKIWSGYSIKIRVKSRKKRDRKKEKLTHDLIM